MSDNIQDADVLDLLTAEEVAALLRCSERWVYELARRGLTPVRIGRKMLFARCDVIAFVRRQRDEGSPRHKPAPQPEPPSSPRKAPPPISSHKW